MFLCKKDTHIDKVSRGLLSRLAQMRVEIINRIREHNFIASPRTGNNGSNQNAGSLCRIN